MKYIILFLLTFTLTACLKNKTTPKETKKVISSNDLNISLIKLISNPEKYDGKTVQVIGFLNLEFEGKAIYLHEQDYSKSITKNGFWVNFSKEIIDKKNLKDYNKKYVLIVGTFDMKSFGHMGLFGGTIKNIIRLDFWDFKK